MRLAKSTCLLSAFMSDYQETNLQLTKAGDSMAGGPESLMTCNRGSEQHLFKANQRKERVLSEQLP